MQTTIEALSNSYRWVEITCRKKNGEKSGDAALSWRSAQLDDFVLGRRVDQLLDLELLLDDRSHVVGVNQAVEEWQQVEQFVIALIFVPSLDRDAVVDLNA